MPSALQPEEEGQSPTDFCFVPWEPMRSLATVGI